MLLQESLMLQKGEAITSWDYSIVVQLLRIYTALYQLNVIQTILHQLKQLTFSVPQQWKNHDSKYDKI